jgi:hypothetical protein
LSNSINYRSRREGEEHFQRWWFCIPLGSSGREVKSANFMCHWTQTYRPWQLCGPWISHSQQECTWILQGQGAIQLLDITFLTDLRHTFEHSSWPVFLLQFYKEPKSIVMWYMWPRYCCYWDLFIWLFYWLHLFIIIIILRFEINNTLLHFLWDKTGVL